MIRILLSSILIFALNLTGNSQTDTQKFEFSPKTAHPNARILMKEDFFWSPIDEYGPFGSDAGSGAAYEFQIWRKTHTATSPIIYLKQLIDSWNYPPFAWDELDTAKIKLYISAPAHLDESFIAQMIEALKKQNERYSSMPGGGKKLTEEQIRQIAINSQTNMGGSFLSSIDEAIIGTAFAQFVIEGKVDPNIKDYAAKTIQREMLPIITRQFGQPDQVKAHDDKMNKLLQVVKKMPTQG
jgi:uncharacterized protein YfeS